MQTKLKLSLIFAIVLVAAVLAATLVTTSHSLAAEQAVADDYFITLETVATTPIDPVGLAQAGDDRLFVVERSGTIRIIDGDTLLDTPFLNVSSKLAYDNWEQGLLGLAFHPDYEQNGYFYVNYTGSDRDTRVSRFEVSDDDPNRADPNSEQVVLKVAQPEDDHNAGALVFGPDGYLYVALGDGGLTAGFRNAQETDTLLGKLLRIDVDGEAQGAPDCDISGQQQYTVPADNPFHDGPGSDCDEIWVLGLRNPWRFSFDSVSGDLFIGDVGLAGYEEVNLLPAGSGGGANFGWPCYEGHDAFLSQFCQPTDTTGDFVFPIGGYAHQDGDCLAMVGGGVYHGDDYPQMQGHYFFADFCTGQVWRLRPDGDGWQQRRLLDPEHTVTSLFVDRHGELYATGLEGGVYRVHAQQPSDHGYLPIVVQP